MNKYSGLSSAELDRQIAERVMGWELVNYGFGWQPPNDPGTDVLQPWAEDETTFFRDVVPRMREKAKESGVLLGFMCGFDEMGRVWAQFYKPSVVLGDAEEKDITTPRAGCEAALLALDELEKGDKK